MTHTILIAGGYGLVGGNVARHLRKSGFGGRLILAGRHPERAAALAAQLDAEVRRLDTADAASVAEALAGADVVIAALKDPYGELLEGALAAPAAFVGITQSADTVSPLLFRLRNRAPRRPVVTAGHWQAGMATHAAHHLVRQFGRVSAIRVAALYDRKDPVGPMTTEDTGEFMARALVRQEGRWRYVDARATGRTVERTEGAAFGAIPMGVLDVVSLAGITNAPDVRFDIGIGDSLGTLAGRAASHEIHYELDGIGHDGAPLKVCATLSDPNGQAHLTAVGLVLAAQALLDIADPLAVPAGWHLPETLVPPARALELAREFGATFSESALRG